MLKNGHVKAHRKTVENPVVGIARPKRFALWVWMTMEANFGESSDLKRGQFKATNAQLAKTGKMPISTFKTFKAELVAEGMVSIERPVSARAASVWTIENYDTYQSKISDPSPAPRRTNNPTITNAVVDGVTGEASPTTGRPPNPQNRQLDKEEPLEEEDKPPIAPQGAAAGAASGEDSTPRKPRRPRKSKPSVPGFGDWPAIATNQKWAKFPYPAEFETVWGVWRGVAKENPEVKRQAVNKPEAYRLCLRWMHEGFTGAQLADATRLYLKPFYNDSGKTHCKLPATLYSHANPIIPDYCDDSETGGFGGVPNLRPWPDPISAYIEVRRAAERLNLPGPDFDKFSATWEQIESMPAEVLDEARKEA